MEQNRFKEFSYAELNRLNIGLVLASMTVEDWKDSDHKEKELAGIESLRKEILNQVDFLMKEEFSDPDADDFELKLINKEQ
jgi:hypothetical protein